MNVIRACQCIVSLSLISGVVLIPQPASAASSSGSAATAPSGTQEATKPPTTGAMNPGGTMRGNTPTGTLRQAPMPPDRAQEVEERVRSGQMEQPTAQGEISERLNQLERGSQRLAGETATGGSSR